MMIFLIRDSAGFMHVDETLSLLICNYNVYCSTSTALPSNCSAEV